jgi:tRNA 2-thiouridine synthesizing protein E
MADSMDAIRNPGAAGREVPGFAHAPPGWSPEAAKAAALGEGLALTEDHWEVVRGLQEFYARHSEGLRVRELIDALDERFHARGGKRFLYQLFPGGPVAQGCRIAGLEPPAGAVDPGFGSVQ